MTARLDQPPRYEIKVPLPLTAYPLLRRWLRLHPVHWRRSYPPRTVNSLYLDDERDSALLDNLNGVGVRHKVRLRWYGDALAQIEGGYLEHKTRRGATGAKQRCHLPDLRIDLRSIRWADLLLPLRHLACAQPAMLRAEFPVLIVRYRRAYYESADGALRLTVDERIVAYDQRFSACPNLTRTLPWPDYLLIELKAPPAQAGRLADLLATLPCRPQRHSKYALGRLSSPDFGAWL